MDKHEIISDIKRVASELGHHPSRREYEQHGKFDKGIVVRRFGLWSEALSACFGEAQPKNKKTYSPIKEILEDFRSTEKSIRHCYDEFPIIILGDTHFPFVSVNALTFAYSMIEKYKPKIIVQIGDLQDQFAYSRFPRTYNTYSAQAEMDMAYAMSKGMWSKIQSIVPGSKCYQLMGNHDMRASKTLFAQAPTLEHLVDIKKYFTFENVITINDPREELQIGRTKFIHGYLGKLGDHRDYLGYSCVVGHSHLGGVSFRRYGSETRWELNAGYLGDPESKALSYTVTRTTRWTHGVGLITEDGPMFVPA